MVSRHRGHWKYTILIPGSADERKNLEHKIEANGGCYKPNLTKEESHLIAKEPVGAKYEFATRWGIKTVAIEWLEQCLERGMILEETPFHPRIPAENRGAGAWIRKPTSTTSLGKRGREPEGIPNQSRKLRRTISAKLEREHSGIWGDIASYEVKPSDVTKSAWDEDREDPPEDFKKREDTQSGHTETPTVPERTVSGVDMLLGNQSRKEEIFQNKVFVLYGYNEQKATILEGHLCSHGGNIMDFNTLMMPNRVTNMKDLYILIPHDMSPHQVPRRNDESLLDIMAT